MSESPEQKKGYTFCLPKQEKSTAPSKPTIPPDLFPTFPKIFLKAKLKITEMKKNILSLIKIKLLYSKLFLFVIPENFGVSSIQNEKIYLESNKSQ